MRQLLLSMIFIGMVPTGMADAASIQCKHVVLSRPESVRQTIRSIRENWAALVSRVKPTYQATSFDLRILSTDRRKTVFLPKVLRARAIQEVTDLQSAYRQIGFSFRSFVQVLVEAHPGAMGQLGLSESGKFIWKDTAGDTPWVGSAIQFIVIPGLFRDRDLFVGRTHRKGFQDKPRILAIPAVTSTYHSIENRFLIAHELAHLTENSHGHRDLMWREARADFLAFLTTGHTDVVLPEGIELEMVRKDGSIFKQKVTTVRSMSQPSIASVGELWPSLGAYHRNSQILSSALYNLEQMISRDRAIEFVKWMDRLEGTEVIPYLEPKPTELDPDFQAEPNTEYINNKDLIAVRSSITDHLKRVGHLFRRWAEEADLALNERTVLLEILTERGI